MVVVVETSHSLTRIGHSRRQLVVLKAVAAATGAAGGGAVRRLRLWRNSRHQLRRMM